MIYEADAALGICGVYRHVYAIPAYAEQPEALHALLTQIDEAGVLVVLVVNAPVSAPADRLRATEQLLAWARSWGRPVAERGNVTLRTANGLSLLVLDRVSAGLRLTHGVGQARAIAGKVCQALSESGKLLGHFMHCLDADSLPVSGACEQLEQMWAPGVAGAVRSVIGDGGAGSALFDTMARAYLIQTQRTGSPWAILPSGPGLSVDLSHYGAIGGFRSQPNSEDAAMIHDLGCVGTLLRPPGGRVVTSGRTDQRVPLKSHAGRMERVALGLQTGLPPTGINPDLFLHMRSVHSIAQSYCRNPTTSKNYSDRLREECRMQQDVRPDLLEMTIVEAFGALDGRPLPSDPVAAYRNLYGGFTMREQTLLCRKLGQTAFPPVPVPKALETLGIVCDDPTWQEPLRQILALEQAECTSPTGSFTWAG